MKDRKQLYLASVIIAVTLATNLVQAASDVTLSITNHALAGTNSNESTAEWSVKTREALIAEWLDKYANSDDAQVLIGDAYRIGGKSAQARKHWEQAIQIMPKRADVFYKLGVLAAETGDSEAAVENWQKALSIKPNMPGLKWRMASELIDLGRHDEAIKILTEEVAAAPQNSSAWYLLGQAHLELKHNQEALDAYNRAVNLNPEHSGAHYGLMTAYTRLNQPEKAREEKTVFDRLKAGQMESNKSMEASENKPSLAALNLAQLLFDAHQFYKSKREFSRAEQVLKQAIQLKPENIDYRLGLAGLYADTGRPEDAIKVCEEILTSDPQNRFCYLNIGILTSRLNRFEEAEKAFRHAIELAPRSSEGYQQLSRLFLKRGVNLTEAKSLAQTAADLKPTADNLYLLAWACDRTGDVSLGVEAIDAALRLDPGKQRYQELRDALKQRVSKK